VVGATFLLFGLINGGSQFWAEKEFRNYTIPIISTTIVTGLVIFNSVCKFQPVLKNTKFPERLKIRKPTTQSGPWTLWASTS